MARGTGAGSEHLGSPRGGPGPGTPPRFFDLFRMLCEHEVVFVLIGGFAVTVHGPARLTKDIDIVPDPDAANMAKLWDALAAIQATPAEFQDVKPHELPVPFTREGFIAGGGNWALYTTLGRVDVIPYVESADGQMLYSELRENAVRVDLDEIGAPIWVASVADLIAMKEHANRDVDRIDLTALRMAQGDEI